MVLRTLGDLTSPKINPAAAKADIRAGRRASPAKAPAVPVMGAGRAGSFESALAESQARNAIIDDVLEGPVSQQTQRQLARLKESGSRGQLARELRQGRAPALAEALLKNHALEGADIPGADPLAQEASLALVERAAVQAAQATAQADEAMASAGQAMASADGGLATAALRATNRRPISLTGGATIAAGVDTGRIFNPAQLSAFKQRNGLGIPLGRAAAIDDAPRQVAAVDRAVADGARKLIRGVQEAVRTTNPEPETPKPAETPAPDKPQGLSGGDIDAIVDKVGQALGLDPSLIKAVIKTESNFDKSAVSPAGAQGLMQLMPGTAREMGVQDPFNPLENIWGGARYLKRMLDSHGGNLDRALAAYNWGPGNLQKYGNKRMPRETRRYIEVVNRNYNNFKRQTKTAEA